MNVIPRFGFGSLEFPDDGFNAHRPVSTNEN